MPWRNIKGHDGPLEAIRRLAAAGKLPHAFFFAGPASIGKFTFAKKLAQALLCDRTTESALDPCEACPSCAQAAAETHPDLLIVLKPEDKHELPIESIRALNRDLALKPAGGGRKVAIVDDADDLNEAASNAFLKTLEEPPPGAVLILIGSAPELQLDTILSRCRLLRFEPLSRENIAAILLEQGLALDAAEADRLAARGDGGLRRAAAGADPELAKFRRDMLDQIAQGRGFDAPGLARRIETYCRESGKLSVNHRDRARFLIEEVAGLFRGVLFRTAGLEPPCPDPDDQACVDALAECLDPEEALILADRCLEAEARIERMANLGLVLETWTQDLSKFVDPQ